MKTKQIIKLSKFVLLCVLISMTFGACKKRQDTTTADSQANVSATSSNPSDALSLADGTLIADLNNANVVAVFYMDTQNNKLLGVGVLKDGGSSDNSNALGLAGETSNPSSPSLVRRTLNGKSATPSNKIIYQNLVFDLPEGYYGVLNSQTGRQKVLGEGANGVGFLIQDADGKQFVLKYFKTGAGLIENMADLVSVAEKSVLLGDQGASMRDKFIQSERQMSAKEDILFHTQQDTERALLLGVSLEHYQNPELIADPDLKSKVLLAKQGGVGAVSVKAVDMTYGPANDPKQVVKHTFLIKEKVEGTRLRELIQGGEGIPKFTPAAAEAIIQSIDTMSRNGLFYADLNTANWILKQHVDEHGTPIEVWDATPFDMKPGVKVEGITYSGVQNAKGMLGKVSPLGSPTGFSRELYVTAAQAVGTGRSQPDLSSPEAKANMELLDSRLRTYMKILEGTSSPASPLRASPKSPVVPHGKL